MKEVDTEESGKGQLQEDSYHSKVVGLKSLVEVQEATDDDQGVVCRNEDWK